MEVHEVESCVRGYHIYSDIWNPDVGDILNCERESGNRIDSYAVAIKSGASVIGHVPRKLSAACSLFLSLGGTINCEITDNHRRYSADLPQGGLEIPCKFIFCASSSLLCKLKKLIRSMPPIQVESANSLKRNRASKQSSNGANEQGTSSIELPTKKLKVDVVEIEDDVSTVESFDKLWLKFDRLTLTVADMNMIVKG